MGKLLTCSLQRALKKTILGFSIVSPHTTNVNSINVVTFSPIHCLLILIYEKLNLGEWKRTNMELELICEFQASLQHNKMQLSRSKT